MILFSRGCFTVLLALSFASEVFGQAQMDPDGSQRSNVLLSCAERNSVESLRRKCDLPNDLAHGYPCNPERYGSIAVVNETPTRLFIYLNGMHGESLGYVNPGKLAYFLVESGYCNRIEASPLPAEDVSLPLKASYKVEFYTPHIRFGPHAKYGNSTVVFR